MYLVFSLLLACSSRSTNGEAQTSPSEVKVTQVDPRSLSVTTIQGETMSPEQLTDKVVLYVNVASECGFTKQYEGLQALYEQHRDDGLVIVGVPCNQFGGQEPGSPVEIATFCKKNYGVTFPLLEKQDVNGEQRSALYTALIDSEKGKGRNVKWNFEKFLVGRDGTVLERFGSMVKPESNKLKNAIKNAL